jgi:hypothetical protein
MMMRVLKEGKYLIKVRVLIKIIEQNYDKAIYPNKIY